MFTVAPGYGRCIGRAIWRWKEGFCLFPQAHKEVIHQHRARSGVQFAPLPSPLDHTTDRPQGKSCVILEPQPIRMEGGDFGSELAIFPPWRTLHGTVL